MKFRIRSSRNERIGETNYLASVSDLMAALLLIFIILVAVAVLQARVAGDEAAQRAAQLSEVQGRLTQVENRLLGNHRARGGMLASMGDRLKKEFGLVVTIDPARGVMRVPESAVTFETGSALLDERNSAHLMQIGRVLYEHALCFEAETLKRMPGACRKVNPNGNMLDAIFIEGHTDNTQFAGDMTDARNRRLSTARSNAVYDLMVAKNPLLSRLKNPQGESLFSLSGYGSARPVPGHNHVRPTDDSANRRIEFRFIFAEPKMTEAEKTMIGRYP